MKPVVGFHACAARCCMRPKEECLLENLTACCKTNTTYSYIDMPINYTVDFKGRIGKSKKFKYFLGIGPNISYWLGGNGTLFSSELEENNKDAFY